MTNKTFRYIIFLIIVLFFFSSVQAAKDKAFTIVIDPGHGGRDPGAVGASAKEKAINLSVALKLGDLIQSNHSDVRVVYTRRTDVFIELDERANIANRNKADLFISLHTNAVKRGSTVTGTETYTLGLARSDENLEVAMRENSAILLEDDYLQKYEGFDPTSSESYIIFEFMQNKHMEQSIGLASEVQKFFSSSNRVDRGVRQAGFLVLRKTSMPSVLIELGYISNREEERYMKSEAGQNKLAAAVYNAFAKYKWEYDRKRGALGVNAQAPTFVNASEFQSVSTGPINDDGDPPVGSEEAILQKKNGGRGAVRSVSAKDLKTENVNVVSSNSIENKTINKDQVIYKIQILTSDKKLSSNSKLFKGYKPVDFYMEKGIYKYTYGESTSFEEIKKQRRQLARDFKDAFIVAFKGEKKVKY